MKTLKESNEYKDGKKMDSQFVDVFNTFEPVEVEICCEKHGKHLVQAFKTDRGEIMGNMCPLCQKEREEEEQKKEAAKQERLKIEKMIASNIEKEYWYKTLDDFNPTTPKQKEMLLATKDLIKNQRGKLVLIGSNGVGKTHMGSMAVKELGGFIYSMYEIATLIRQSYSRLAKKTELEIVNELASVPMLVIDEIGRSSGSSSEMNWLSYLIDKRHTRDLPLMILSNKHLKRDCPTGGCENCFEKNFDNDVLSRLRENGKIIVIEKAAPDYRARKQEDK